MSIEKVDYKKWVEETSNKLYFDDKTNVKTKKDFINQVLNSKQYQEYRDDTTIIDTPEWIKALRDLMYNMEAYYVVYGYDRFIEVFEDLIQDEINDEEELTDIYMFSFDEWVEGVLNDYDIIPYFEETNIEKLKETMKKVFNKYYLNNLKGYVPEKYEKYFIDGNDVDITTCLTEGYFSKWKYNNKIYYIYSMYWGEADKFLYNYDVYANEKDAKEHILYEWNNCYDKEAIADMCGYSVEKYKKECIDRDKHLTNLLLDMHMYSGWFNHYKESVKTIPELLWEVF